MKNILYLLFFCLIACNEPAQNNSIKKDSVYAGLIKMYKPLDFDTLKVSPAENADSIGYKFKGEKIDANRLKLLPIDISDDDSNGLFAVYQFKIDNHRTGLITRIPSQYSSSSITLFIYDTITDCITDHFELADTFGDEGWSFVKNGYIFKDRNGRFKYLILKVDKNQDPDSPNKAAIITGTCTLIGLDKVKHDTISKNAEPYLAKFTKF